MSPQVLELKLHPDDRGMVYGALTNLDEKKIKRTYVVHNWSKGMIRAWHGHMLADTYIHVVSGAAKIAAVPMYGGGKKLVTVLSEYTPGIVHVPPGYYNGTMSLVDNTVILVYSTLLLDEVKNDDHRAHYTEHGGDEIWEIKPR